VAFLRGGGNQVSESQEFVDRAVPRAAGKAWGAHLFTFPNSKSWTHPWCCKTTGAVWQQRVHVRRV